ncbi:hypothetical protein [Microscilla marina]|uniref:Tetratricopeptide repeat domain protein n=1 Tax=Microscilla marina ATCC 23134 TaxID=313606 RepID=A1ZJV2_MICM2|nr:hypothetical protein [Microscilla marina]EAY29405.1 tetratricopeptide repeat domain protein [Microscilla marina ATCC 23134]
MIKYLTILSLFLVINPLTYVSEVNDTQWKAQKAFEDKNYLVAIHRYEHLVEQLQINDPNVYINLAHAYYKTKKWLNARKYYVLASKNENPTLSSLAYHQLGMISEENYNQDSSIEDLRTALKLFKKAIKKNPKNLEARYNYELLRKKLEALRKFAEKNSSKKKRKSQSRKTKSNGNGEKQKTVSEEGEGDSEEKRAKKKESKNGKDRLEKQDPEGKEDGSKTGNKKKDKNKLREDKLKAVNINQEKIKTIFEALKNQEIQYLQQKRRRNKKAKKGYEKSKPDW